MPELIGYEFLAKKCCCASCKAMLVRQIYMLASYSGDLNVEPEWAPQTQTVRQNEEFYWSEAEYNFNKCCKAKLYSYMRETTIRSQMQRAMNRGENYMAWQVRTGFMLCNNISTVLTARECIQMLTNTREYLHSKIDSNSRNARQADLGRRALDAAARKEWVTYNRVCPEWMSGMTPAQFYKHFGFWATNLPHTDKDHAEVGLEPLPAIPAAAPNPGWISDANPPAMAADFIAQYRARPGLPPMNLVVDRADRAWRRVRRPGL